MFTGISTYAGFLVTAIVVLTGAAILHGGAAAADPNQDDQFLALLDKEGIPALEGVPSLIDTAHKVCRALDAGTPAGAVVNSLVTFAQSDNPGADRGRLERTETRFVRAAVGAYCPYDQGKIASIMANPAPGPNGPTHRFAAYAHNAVNSGSDLREPPPARDMINPSAAWQEPTGTLDTVLASLIGALPGGVPPPNPPQIPIPPPPTGQTLTPPRPIAAPPPPKQPPHPPQQVEPAPPQEPPPPPQQVEPAPQEPPPPPQEPPPPPQQPPPPPQQPPPPPQQPPPPPQQPPPPPQRVEPSTTPPGPPGRVRLAP
jgi:hypothetical protein